MADWGLRKPHGPETNQKDLKTYTPSSARGAARGLKVPTWEGLTSSLLGSAQASGSTDARSAWHLLLRRHLLPPQDGHLLGHMTYL